MGKIYIPNNMALIRMWIRKNLMLFVRLILSFGLIAFVIYMVGLADIVKNILSLSIYQVFLFLITFPISWFFAALNLKILLLPLNKDIPFIRQFYYRSITTSLGLISPGKVGEYSIVKFLKNYNVSIAESTAIFVIDNLITVLVLLIFSLMGFFLFFEVKESVILTLIFLGGFLLVLGLLFFPKPRQLLVSLIPFRFAKRLKGCSNTLNLYIKENLWLISINLLVTLVKFSVTAFIFYLIVLSFGETPTVLNVFIIIALVTLVSLIPVSLSGLGVREYSSIYLFGLIGIASSVIATIHIVYSFIGYGLALVAIWLFR